MNAYVKIAIKVGIVLIICLVLIVAYNVIGAKKFKRQTNRLKKDLAAQEEIAVRIDSLLAYQDVLPQIRKVQYQDMQTIRNLVPDSGEFTLTGYLRVIHKMLTDNHLETDGIAISGGAKAPGKTKFEEAFSSDITALQKELDKIKEALQWFKDNMSLMNSLIISYQFYSLMSTGTENYKAIISGIESHRFTMSVRGKYSDIKKFTFDIFNMRPHTALVNFQMMPSGSGFGTTRMYKASFTIITYGDANDAPPLWDIYSGNQKLALATEESATEETKEKIEGAA